MVTGNPNPNDKSSKYGLLTPANGSIVSIFATQSVITTFQPHCDLYTTVPHIHQLSRLEQIRITAIGKIRPLKHFHLTYTSVSDIILLLNLLM